MRKDASVIIMSSHLCITSLSKRCKCETKSLKLLRSHRNRELKDSMITYTNNLREHNRLNPSHELTIPQIKSDNLVDEFYLSMLELSRCASCRSELTGINALKKAKVETHSVNCEEDICSRGYLIDTFEENKKDLKNVLLKHKQGFSTLLTNATPLITISKWIRTKPSLRALTLFL